MTAAETLLLTLYRLGGVHGFDAAVPESELAVRCWLADRQRFGLAGYEQQHPNANAVRVILCSHKPSSLAARGLIVRVRPLTWTLTEKGIAAARKLIGGTVAA